MLTRVAVVVPARDEERLLPGCLAAILTAAERVRDALDVHLIVVADSCQDDTAAIASAFGARVVVVDDGVVGAARAAGAEAGLEALPSSTWLACTDADTEVPPDWLVGQLAHARAGADVVVGTVAVADWGEWPAGTGPVFDRAYRERFRGSGHAHVHGANLGIRGSAYRRVGGFLPVALGEDRVLVGAAVRAGLRVVMTADSPVRTSARRRARAPGGFSAALAALTITG